MLDIDINKLITFELLLFYFAQITFVLTKQSTMTANNILPFMHNCKYLESAITTYGITAINYNGYEWRYVSKFAIPNGVEMSLDKIVISYLFNK